MKRIAFFLLTFPLLFISCEREPVADFLASATEVGIRETIVFTNRSVDSDDFEWDFGDGYTSTRYNASHYYDEPGNYVVQLKAYGREGVSVASLNIRVVQTYLEITVEEYYEPYYLVPDVRVRLYPTVQDWENETNMIAQGNTDDEGVVVFAGLYPKRYYVDVYGPNHDNYQLAEDDVLFIETDVLEPGFYNKFTALVDYYPPGMRSSDDTKALKSLKKSAIIKTEPRVAKERLKNK